MPEVATEAEAERRLSTGASENDWLDPDQSRITPTEDSIPESTDGEESPGYASIPPFEADGFSRQISEESSRTREEPIYAVPNKLKKIQTADKSLANDDFEIHVDDGQSAPETTPSGPATWQLERGIWQDDGRHSSSSVSSLSSDDEKSTSSSSRIELSKEDIIFHPPPNDLSLPDLMDETVSQNEWNLRV